MFKYIKDYYAKGLYTTADLLTLKNGEMLTEDEYNELVGATK